MRTDGLDAAWAKATSEVQTWRTVSVRFTPNPQAPWVFTVDSGYGGQPQKRQTLTIDRATAAVVKSESFDNLTLGRRMRSWLRFAHTGEFYGLIGPDHRGCRVSRRCGPRLHRPFPRSPTILFLALG